MEVLHQLASYSERQPSLDRKEIPEVVCYEKQSCPGGMWNLNWRVGVDDNGEPVHGSMYYKMFTNESKEYMEYADYTFEEHFKGKNVPSYMPRAVIREYIIARCKKYNVIDSITFDHAVRRVEFDDECKMFRVHVTNVRTKLEKDVELYDQVIVASGHFSTPNMPSFPGIESFPGRIFHSHDFRHAEEFEGKSVLLIGGSFSAEDLALHGIKAKAKGITISCRSSIGLNWCHPVEERALLTHVEGRRVNFSDGSSKEFDVIVFCTGYKHNFPFMEQSLRLDRLVSGHRLLSSPELYKNIVWKTNPGLMYLAGCTRVFEAQAPWIVKYLVGEINFPDDPQPTINEWLNRNTEAMHLNPLDYMSFKNDIMQDWVREAKYNYDIDKLEMLKQIYLDKKRNPLTFRDQCYTSKYTGITSAEPKIPYMEIQDDSKETYMNSGIVDINAGGKKEC